MSAVTGIISLSLDLFADEVSSLLRFETSSLICFCLWSVLFLFSLGILIISSMYQPIITTKINKKNHINIQHQCFMSKYNHNQCKTVKSLLTQSSIAYKVYVQIKALHYLSFPSKHKLKKSLLTTI